MNPMICFHTNELIIKDTFMKLYHLLVAKESIYYPFYYKILEKKQEYYLSYCDKRKIYESNLKIPKSKDPINEKHKLMDAFDYQNKVLYRQTIELYYQQCIQSCKTTLDISDEIRSLQISNLHKELHTFLQSPDLCYQDIFKKHPDFCFSSSEPMSGETIKQIRKNITQTLGIKISYEHPIFQMLKRGFGMYLESMPEELDSSKKYDQ